MSERFMSDRLKLMAAAVLLNGLVAGAFSTAHAHDKPSHPTPPRMTLTGEGEVSASPDMAIVTLTVLREAQTSREALTSANEAVGKLLASLKEFNVAERDMQTSGLSIQPRYVHPNRNNDLKEARIVGYTVSNSVTVRLRDLAKVGDVLDRAVTLGVNRSGGLRFVNENPRAQMTQARRQAMEDAMERAKTLTEAAGVRLGRIVSIEEQSFQTRPMSLARNAAAPADAAESVPLASGENTYRVNVNVVFEIEQ